MRAIDKTTLGGRIRHVRRKLHMSQEEFGKKIYVKTKSVSRYERGDTIPTADIITDICREYGVSADWLLGLSDDEHSRNQEKGE